MNKRCLLHKSKLDALKDWLDSKSIAYRPGKGDWQVLQILTPDHGWQVVFDRLDSPEHYSLNEKLTKLVREFIEETRR